MNYVEVAVVLIHPEDYVADLLIHELAALGFESFEENDMGFKAYVPSSILDPRQVSETVGKIFGPFIEVSQLSFEINLILHKNWNQDWERNFKPVSLGLELYIRAPFHEKSGKYTYELIIEPKMAFGTGHHETTCLMARMLLMNSPQKKRVLDLGCGTGILAILADKMGARSTLAVDLDELCVQSALENGLINQTAHMEVLQGTAASIGRKPAIVLDPFDFILANINRNVLIGDMQDFGLLLGEGGNLLLSGFYDGHDLDLITEAARTVDLKYLTHISANRWCAAHFYK